MSLDAVEHGRAQRTRGDGRRRGMAARFGDERDRHGQRRSEKAQRIDEAGARQQHREQDGHADAGQYRRADRAERNQEHGVERFDIGQQPAHQVAAAEAAAERYQGEQAGEQPAAQAGQQP